MTGMPRAWQALVSFEKTSTLAASRCFVAGLQRQRNQGDIHAFAQGIQRIVGEDALRAGVGELEAIDRVPIEPHDGQRAFRAGEDAAAMPNHARGQQHRVHRRVDLGRRGGQILHAGDRPVEQPVVDGDNHRAAVAHQTLQTNRSSVQCHEEASYWLIVIAIVPAIQANCGIFISSPSFRAD